jgi:hypothetical protein
MKIRGIGKRGAFSYVWALVSVVIIAILIIAIVSYSKLTGNVVYPVDSNRQFKSASFSCANGAASQLESKNCRSAAYWRNYADKFCRNLCEATEDYSLDNVQNVDPACDMGRLNLYKECSGNDILPVGSGSVLVGEDCVASSECVFASYCDNMPYGVCKYNENVPVGGDCASDSQCVSGICMGNVCAEIQTTTPTSTATKTITTFITWTQSDTQSGTTTTGDITTAPPLVCACGHSTQKGCYTDPVTGATHCFDETETVCFQFELNPSNPTQGKLVLEDGKSPIPGVPTGYIQLNQPTGALAQGMIPGASAQVGAWEIPTGAWIAIGAVGLVIGVYAICASYAPHPPTKTCPSDDMDQTKASGNIGCAFGTVQEGVCWNCQKKIEGAATVYFWEKFAGLLMSCPGPTGECVAGA